MAVRATAQMKELNGHKFTKIATGADLAEAEDNLAAVVGITVGTVERVTASIEIEEADFPTPNGGIGYSDATFHFRKGTNDVNVHFEQLSNSFANDPADGYVDKTKPEIIDYIAAFNLMRADGGGWQLVEGRYVK